MTKRKRGGRPRKINAPREASGKVDRDWSTREAAKAATVVGKEARMRIYGLTAKNASQPDAATVIGRMFLAGKLTADQRDAAQKYLQVRNAYHRSIDAKPDYVEPSPSEDPEIALRDKEDATTNPPITFEEFCEGARERYDDMRDALQALAQELRSPAPIAALDVFVVRDIHMSELEGDLRLALNCLHRLLGFGGKEKPARIRSWMAA